MKKIPLLLAILFCSIGSNIYFASAQCLSRTIIKDCKSNFVKPFKCSGIWMREFVFDKKPKLIEGHFVAFEGEEYQIIFCAADSEEPVNITIYDNIISSKKAVKLFDNTKTKDIDILQFNPSKSGDYYVYYKIPPSNTGKPKSGCIMLLIGTEIEIKEKD